MPKTRMPLLKEDKPSKRMSRKITIILLLLFIALLAVIFFRSSVSKITAIHFQGINIHPGRNCLPQAVLRSADSSSQSPEIPWKVH